jgi:hypothetical protein
MKYTPIVPLDFLLPWYICVLTLELVKLQTFLMISDNCALQLMGEINRAP